MKSSPRSAPAAWERCIARAIRGSSATSRIKIVPEAYSGDAERIELVIQGGRGWTPRELLGEARGHRRFVDEGSTVPGRCEPSMKVAVT
jgi:hypothetical protein